MSNTARRMPLQNNQNVVNSPIRNPSAMAAAKQKRSFANIQREEAYAQPPPAKKQMLETGIPRPLNSPSKRTAKAQAAPATRRNASTYEARLARERSVHHHQAESTTSRYTEKDLEEIRQWKEHHRGRFPKMVFYFDNLPVDLRARLTRQIEKLGAREHKFFSNEITHVVTTRTIPPEKSARQREEEAAHAAVAESRPDHDQLQTINPSLLRLTDQPVKRRLFDTASSAAVPNRKPLSLAPDARPKKNMDVLHRARDMGKKIWSIEKLQRMLSMLLEEDLLISATIAYGGSRHASTRANHHESRTTQENNLLQLLHNERVNGPSDRDRTVATQELHYFKGPYIYVYDFEEKQKPIMVREYAKVADKADGDWPQFRSATLGRCPFVEDWDPRAAAEEAAKTKATKAKEREKEKEKTKAAKVAAAERHAADTRSVLQPPEAPSMKGATERKATGDTGSAHTRGSSTASGEFVNPPKPNKFAFRHTFTSTNRAASTRLFGGEPVASGVQPSNVTSAIRSQMISSTAATPGAIGVLSKEVHGLQRKVLQRNSSHEQGHRRANSTETSFQDGQRALGRTSSRRLDVVDEKEKATRNGEGGVKPRAQADKRVVKAKKRDPKPGYCENCQDKFDDFDDHIASRKHRRFADNQDNWTDLDDLLAELQRQPKTKSFRSRTLNTSDDNTRYSAH